MFGHLKQTVDKALLDFSPKNVIDLMSDVLKMRKCTYAPDDVSNNLLLVKYSS